MGPENSTTILEDSLAIFYEVKYSLALRTRRSPPLNLLKRNEVYIYTDLYRDIHSSFIFNNPKLQIIHTLTGKWVSKLWYSQTMESDNKKEPITDKHYNMDVNYIEWKQSKEKKKDIPYDSFIQNFRK